MWSHLSLNRLVLVDFIISCLGSVTAFLYSFLFEDALAWQVVYAICLCAWIFATVVNIFSLSRERVRRDEMSRRHERASGNFAYKIAQLVLMVCILLIVGLDTGITLSAPMVFAVSFLLYAAQSGSYLLMERRGLKVDADTDY